MKAHENPFTTGQLEERLAFDPELIGSDWIALLDKWSLLGCRACVVGPHGAGKTTFLDALSSRLDRPVRRFFFNRDHRKLTDEDLERMEFGGAAVWLADGDMHLGLRDRRRFHEASRHAAGLISARHRARGLPVLLHLRPDLALAKELLHRVYPEGAVDFEADLAERFRKHRGNLRHLWLDCYDRLAGGSDEPHQCMAEGFLEGADTHFVAYSGAQGGGGLRHAGVHPLAQEAGDGGG